MGDLLGNTGPVMKIRRTFDCVVIVLAHPPEANPRKVLGHSSQTNNTEMVLLVECDKENDPTLITAEVIRSKDGPEGVELFYRVDPTTVPVPQRIEKPDEHAPEHKLGRQPEDPDMIFACVIRHKLAERDHTTFDTGLANRQLAELLTPKGDTPEDITTWSSRVSRMKKRLENIQVKKVLAPEKSPYDDLTCRGNLYGKTQIVWRWFDTGCPPYGRSDASGGCPTTFSEPFSNCADDSQEGAFSESFSGFLQDKVIH